MEAAVATNFVAGGSRRRARPWITAPLFLLMSCWNGPAQAQEPPAASTQPEAMVQLSFGTEVELKVLVDYVSQRLGVKILYDEQIQGKQISIQAPGDVPASSLLQLLESALKMKDLALVDAGVPGWKRIEAASKLAAIARDGDAQQALAEYGPAVAVTQAFALKRAQAQQVDQLIKPFLSPTGANSIPLTEQNMLIVTDYATNVLKIGKLIEMIDSDKPEVLIEFYTPRHLTSDNLAQKATELLAARATARGETLTAKLSADAQTDQLTLVATPNDLAEIRSLLRALDVPRGTSTEIYRVRYIDAERLERLIKELVDPAIAQRALRTTIDRDDNLLIATTTPEIHGQIASLQRMLDVAGAQARQAPVQMYKIKNVTALELLATLRAIEGGVSAPLDAGMPLPTDGRIRALRGGAVPGPNVPPNQPWPQPPSYEEVPEIRGPGAQSGKTTERRTSAQLASYQEPVTQSGAPVAPAAAADTGAMEVPESALGRAQISADANTNSLIVVADPDVQRIYADLIRTLDRRRPQVLIEAKLVIIDTSDDFALGVELSGGDGEGDNRLFAFSSFGLSDVDPVTGALSLIPGTGFNGTLVQPEVADVVVRALANHRRSRVISAPRVLVNDNATGVLTSVAEVPFTSVNASQTVATTSFAGFAEAGTTITVTPHISDDNHLQLEYQITLNTFTGTGSAGIPPPRQTDEVQSEITIPDGHTVIVGGLNRRSRSQTNNGIPFVELLPLGRYLGGSETRNADSSTLFVFLRPVVLRDDKFKDLRFLSERDTRQAKISSGYPCSQPVLIK